MAELSDIKVELMKLPEKERAVLAADLLDSLPRVLWDADEGVAEAMRRSEEMDKDPNASLSLEALRDAIRKR
jgi:putative addiction module component (TIGR02574 family)